MPTSKLNVIILVKDMIGHERLNGLALMSIHRDVEIDFDDVLNRFARQHERRMELIDVLSEIPS